MSRQFFAIPKSPVWGKGWCNLFSISQLCSVHIWLCSIGAVGPRMVFSSILLEVISSRSAAFVFLSFLMTTLSFSWVKCPSLMCRWLLILFVIDLSLILRDFPIRFFKCTFHMWIRSWLSAFFFLVLGMLFLLLTSFTVSYALRDCLFSTEFLILLIWPWMYLFLLYTLIRSLGAFLNFWALALVGLILLHKDPVFTLSRYFSTATVS